MTDTLDALYRAIVQQPGEDTPRLLYADALDERGAPGDAERAEFVRLQMELAAIGPPRTVVETVYTIGRGLAEINARRHELTIDSDRPFPIGTRLDVVLKESHTPGGRAASMSGWVVESFWRTLDGAWSLKMTMDEYSVPYPTDRARDLHKRCDDLLIANAAANPDLWCPAPDGFTRSRFHAPTKGARDRKPPHLGGPGVTLVTYTPGQALEIEYRRGFPGALPSITWFDWWVNHVRLAAALPIESVTFDGPPNLQVIGPRAGLPALGTGKAEYVLRSPGETPARGDGIELTDAEYEKLDADGGGRADEVIAEHLLRKRWPTVTEWRFAEEGGSEGEADDDEGDLESWSTSGNDVG